MYVRVAAVKWGERLLIHPKFRELVIAKRHCTSNEVNMHKTDFGKRSSNTVKGSDIPVLNDGFRDFLKSIHKDSIYIKQPWCEWMSHILGLCGVRGEAKETDDHPARNTIERVCYVWGTSWGHRNSWEYSKLCNTWNRLNKRNKLRPKKHLSIQHKIQQMEYVKCKEQAEAKETAEHPAHNATCE